MFAVKFRISHNLRFYETVFAAYAVSESTISFIRPLAVELPAQSHRMSPLELRSGLSLASIFALRMLGLFLVLPVFVLEASKYQGGDNLAWVGFAMGAYGLTQAILQIPFGIASDRWGRKRMMVIGLLLFVAGSVLAALATSVLGLCLGRAVQGAGAISAAVTALLADQTRDEVRTKGMALVGMSIGLMFALSLVISPVLTAKIGLSGLFVVTAVLALAGIVATLFWVPPEPVRKPQKRGGLLAILKQRNLQRLNLGVFVLHMVQLSMWMAVPALMVQAGLAKGQHWWVYLPAVLISFVLMGGLLFPLERKGHLRAVLRICIGLVLFVQIGFAVLSSEFASHWGIWPSAFLLLVFFCGFNALEASQPSLVSRLAPEQARGAALGAYNTLQSLGLFAGGTLGGLLVKFAGSQGLFIFTAGLTACWLLISWHLQVTVDAKT